jgi:hypothetical protein
MRIITRHGLALLVICMRSGHLVQTTAPTQAEAWQETCRQAEAPGMPPEVG